MVILRLISAELLTKRGIFTARDVRCDSLERVASAVGEGSMAMKFVHKVLKE